LTEYDPEDDELIFASLGDNFFEGGSSYDGDSYVQGMSFNFEDRFPQCEMDGLVAFIHNQMKVLATEINKEVTTDTNILKLGLRILAKPLRNIAYLSRLFVISDLTGVRISIIIYIGSIFGKV